MLTLQMFNIFGSHLSVKYLPMIKCSLCRWCSKDEDCEELTVREEGDGSNGLCFRHRDRDNIHFGICLKKM